CSKQGGRFITGRGTKNSEKCLLRQFLGLRRIDNSPPEESKQRLLVSREQLGESFFRSPAESEHQQLVAIGTSRFLPFGIFEIHCRLPAFHSGTIAAVTACTISEGGLSTTLVMPREGKKFPPPYTFGRRKPVCC